MISHKVPDEFLVKLYLWALADFRREIQVGFPLLREVDCRTTYSILGMMDSLPDAERLLFASFLVKRHHQRAVEALGENKTTEGQDFFLEQMGKSFCVINRYERERIQQAQSLGPLLGGDKARQAVLKQVKKELHEPFCVWPSSEYGPGSAFEVIIGGFRIMTSFFRQTGVSLSYEHTIQNKEMEPGVLDFKKTFFLRRLSLYSWLGISQETWWVDLRVGDVERVARHVARLCRHFIDGVRIILDDSYLK